MSILRSNRGSSSILVALVLVILVVFSVLAVTTSVSNLRLARKNAAAAGVYYSLDSEGERFLYEIHRDLRAAEKSADEAISAFSGGVFESSGLPEPIAGVIAEDWNKCGSDEEKRNYLQMLYPKLVIYYTQNEIAKAYPDSIADSAADYAGDPALYKDGDVRLSFNVERTFVLKDEDHFRYLNATLNISDPAKGKKPDEMCTVREWRLWQEPFEYKNKLDLWEGEP